MDDGVPSASTGTVRVTPPSVSRRRAGRCGTPPHRRLRGSPARTSPRRCAQSSGWTSAMNSALVVGATPGGRPVTGPPRCSRPISPVRTLLNHTPMPSTSRAASSCADCSRSASSARSGDRRRRGAGIAGGELERLAPQLELRHRLPPECSEGVELLRGQLARHVSTTASVPIACPSGVRRARRRRSGWGACRRRMDDRGSGRPARCPRRRKVVGVERGRRTPAIAVFRELDPDSRLEPLRSRSTSVSSAVGV